MSNIIWAIIIIFILYLFIIIYKPRWYVKCNRKDFYDLYEFPEMQTFHKKYKKIRKECVGIMSDVVDIKDDRRVWAETETDTTLHFIEQIQNVTGWIPAWRLKSSKINYNQLYFPLVKSGVRFDNNIERCLVLSDLIDEPNINTVEIIRIKPNNIFTPFIGVPNGTLSYHLGIIIPDPDKCRLTVNGMTQDYQEQKSIIFDPSHHKDDRGKMIRPSIENNTNQDCLILHVNFTY
jgi:aspartyl/asparaginyl beta-hydroxylase (cupin superfamily)